jgi:hypothetical protein
MKSLVENYVEELIEQWLNFYRGRGDPLHIKTLLIFDFL